MRIYMAPMEGLTTYIYRNAYAKYFGGIDCYYTPFLSSMNLSYRETQDVLPEHNAGKKVIPQILTNRTEEFLTIAEQLKEFGYSECNLNLGCPSGTVVAKHRGSGMLTDVRELRGFLDVLFEKCPLAIGIKTRIGLAFESEWEDILEVYRDFPIKELIIHTRVQRDFYREPTRPKSFGLAQEVLGDRMPLIYNGDVNCRQDYEQLGASMSQPEHIMIGRGLIANPNLTAELKCAEQKDVTVLKAFLEEILQGYCDYNKGAEKNVLFKMKEIWTYLGSRFPESERELKKLRKANSLRDYQAAVRTILTEHIN